MASLPGQSSNREFNAHAAEQLFETLEEWNDYLERHVPFYGESLLVPAAAVQDSTD